MKTNHTWKSIGCTSLLRIIMVLVVLLSGSTVLAGTEFTYQGRLSEAGTPINDFADVQFLLYDGSDGLALQVGPTVTLLNYEFIDGLIMSDLDFGAGAFPGADRWLEIQIRKPVGSDPDPYVTLTPRIKIQPVPYAMLSESVEFLPDTALVGTYTLPVNFSSVSNSFVGTHSGSGSALTTLNASSLSFGTLPTNRLSGQYSSVLNLSNGANTFVGSGTGLTGLNADNLSSGYVSLTRFPLGGNWALNSDLMFDFDTFVIDPIADRIGMGTSSPTSSLHLKSLGSLELRLEADSNNSGEADQPNILLTQDGNIISGSFGFFDSSNHLRIRSNDTGSGSINIILEPENRAEIIGAGSPTFIVQQVALSGADAGVSIRGSRNGSTTTNTAYLDLRNFDDNEGAGTDYIMARISSAMQDVSGQTGYLRFFTNQGASLQERMRIDKAGNVGIGTSSPDRLLHLYTGNSGVTPQGNSKLVIENSSSQYINMIAGSGESGLLFGNPGNGNSAGGIIYDSSGAPDGLQFRTNGNLTRMTIQADGDVGMGTTAPEGDLHVRGDSTLGSMIVTPGTANASSQILLTENTSASLGGIVRYDGTANQIRFLGWVSDVETTPHMVINRDNGRVGIGTTSPGAQLDVAGTMRTDVLEIDGGADLSERFNVDSSNGIVEPGMVVCIDPDHPGQLVRSRRAYDHTVAGVISGAGGVSPGMLMGQVGSIADGDYPVALTGRVYVWCDNANGSIQPGDLLTTSDRPGHAMKATDRNRAFGSIIGKAMTPLDDERGLVLVLVSLQ
ncbi:MAG: hypothetical protein O7G85_16795 [Planctomycetota bacterium]|nr:hypothetical protein [Planctomycetota bacterium]